MKTAVWAAAGAAAVSLGLTIGSPGAGGAADVPADTIHPSHFNHPQANPYFPLRPGLVLRYHGPDGGKKFRERVTITHKTRMIEGVRATVVHDVLRRDDGTLAENTHDWYANDNNANVWYLGEATATYSHNGQVQSREGSWQAGVKGAVAGVIMPAGPSPTDAYRQEYWRGKAEDQAWIVQTNQTLRLPLGTYHRVVRTYEWSRLEKHNVSVKFYARGLGIVSEHDIAGGTENFKLVNVTHP